MLKASCLCGRVKFQMPDEFDFMGNCHCTECRKFTGSDYSSAAGIDLAKVTITLGQNDIGIYRKSQETNLAFCKHCGSSLYSHKIASAKLNIRLGVLDSRPSNAPSFHIFVSSKAPWYGINDDLVQFEERPVKD